MIRRTLRATRSGRRIAFAISACFAVLVAVPAGSAQPRAGVLRRVALPNPPRRLAVSPDGALWAAERKRGLTRVAPGGGIERIALDHRVDGMAADERGLVILSRGRLLSVDRRGVVHSSRPLPEGVKQPRGLARRGDEWIVAVDDGGGRYGELVRLDARSLELRGRIGTPAGRVVALAADRDRIYALDSRDDRIYALAFDGDRPVDVVVPPIENLRGICLDGGRLRASFAGVRAVFDVRRDRGAHLGPARRHTLALWVRAGNLGDRPAVVDLILPEPAGSERQAVEWSRWFGAAERQQLEGCVIRRRRVTIPPGATRAFCWIGGVRTHKYSVNHVWRGGTPAPAGPAARDLRPDVAGRFGVRSKRLAKIFAEEIEPERDAIAQLDAMSRAIGKRITYRMDGRWSSADRVVRQGHGSCSEYTTFCLGMLWRAGYDARYAAGTLCGRGRGGWSEDWAGHRWPECAIADGAWVPFDPTWDDRREPRRRYLLSLSDRHFVLVRARQPQDPLGWRYRGTARVARLNGKRRPARLSVHRFSTWLPPVEEAQVERLQQWIAAGGQGERPVASDLASEVWRARLAETDAASAAYVRARVGDAALAVRVRVGAALGRRADRADTRAWVSGVLPAGDRYRTLAEKALDDASATEARWERDFYRARRRIKTSQRRRPFPRLQSRRALPPSPPTIRPSDTAPERPDSKARR